MLETIFGGSESIFLCFLDDFMVDKALILHSFRFCLNYSCHKTEVEKRISK